jgi:hypothetical protein
MGQLPAIICVFCIYLKKIFHFNNKIKFYKLLKKF